MNTHRGGTKPATGRSGQQHNGLPIWLHITVVLFVLALLGWNVVVVGPEGYPATVVLGSIVGAYAGLNELIKRKGGGGTE